MLEKTIKTLNKVAGVSSDPHAGKPADADVNQLREVIHLSSLFWKAISGLGDMAGGLAGLLSKVQA